MSMTQTTAPRTRLGAFGRPVLALACGAAVTASVLSPIQALAMTPPAAQPVNNDAGQTPAEVTVEKTAQVSAMVTANATVKSRLAAKTKALTAKTAAVTLYKNKLALETAAKKALATAVKAKKTSALAALKTKVAAATKAKTVATASVTAKTKAYNNAVTAYNAAVAAARTAAVAAVDAAHYTPIDGTYDGPLTNLHPIVYSTGAVTEHIQVHITILDGYISNITTDGYVGDVIAPGSCNTSGLTSDEALSCNYNQQAVAQLETAATTVNRYDGKIDVSSCSYDPNTFAQLNPNSIACLTGATYTTAGFTTSLHSALISAGFKL